MSSKRKNLIIYHDECTDGFAAYWVIQKFLSEVSEESIGLPAKAGQRMPACDTADIGSAILVDICFEEEDITTLAGQVDHLLVLDHHKTAIEYWKDRQRPYNSDFDFRDNKSGAALALEYFHPRSKPWFIEYVSDHDLNQHNLPNSKEISAYIQSFERTVESYDELENKDVDEARCAGKLILANLEKIAKQVIESSCSFTKFRRLNVPVVNSPFPIYQTVLQQLLLTYPLAVSFYKTKENRWKLSARSREDSAITAYELIESIGKGGGGHKHAAGVTIDSLDDIW